MAKDKLTTKQERFCRFIFEGMSQYDAWIKAGYSSKYHRSMIDTNASNLAKSNKIQMRLSELRNKAESASVATVTERKEFFTEVMRDKKEAARDRLRAGDLLNRTEGIGIDRGEININLVLQKIVTKLEANDMDYSKLTREELKLLAYGEESEGE